MIIRAGADVIDGVAVEKIMVEGGRAVGVRLEDGREFRAKNFVASSVNPNMTFLDLVGPEQLEPRFAKKVENFKYSNTTPLFTLHLSLNEQIRWKAAQDNPDVAKAWYIMAGPESLDDVVELYEDCAKRRIPRTIHLLGGVPSQHDPTQAPPGKCTAFFWQVAPGNLSSSEGGKERWDEVRDEYMERCADHLSYYAENLTPDNIVEKFGFTPLDIERHLPEMVGGDIQIGELSHSQILDKRPFPECSRYGTPIPGLYLCGSSTHPSGNITGAPGYNAANIISRDLGIKPWWNPVDPEEHWKSLGEKEEES
jgi:phytoene dehydrogenase-like protein